MTPEDERAFEHAVTEREITKLIGLMSLINPDVVQRHPPEKVRAMARESLAEAIREVTRPKVPKVFRDAFAD